MIFLEDYLRANTPCVVPEVAERVLAAVREQPGLTLADLTARAKEIDRDAIHTLIATGTVTVDLRAAALAEPERVRLFHDTTTATAHRIVGECVRTTAELPRPDLLALPGTNVLWDERAHTIVNVGAAKIVLQNAEGVLIKFARQNFEELLKTGEMTTPPVAVGTRTDSGLRELLAGASEAEFAEANRRYLIIEPLLSATSLPDDLPLPAGAPVIRTVRRWIKAWRQAKVVYGCGYAGLLPGWERRGNRLPKLPKETLAVIDRFIREQHETIKGKVADRVYGAVVSECEQKGLTVPSSVTFFKKIRLRPKHKQVSDREGHRAAYVHEV